jgi:preprotein translocase subunit SecA
VCPHLRNPISLRDRLARLRGSRVELDLRAYDEALARIADLERDLRHLSDRALQERALLIRERLRAGTPRDTVRTDWYALAREAAGRAIGMRPYDVQILAAIALDEGNVVEMQTGEGKTLAAVLPASLNALAGDGVHVLTFNEYLARRDAGWMGPIYAMLGCSAAFVAHDMTAAQRRAAYRADVTYVTAKQAGFDGLRDALVIDPADELHRPFHLAIVDEADSLMIDEARIPLVIAGNVDRETPSSRPLAGVVASLMPGVDFTTDEYGRNVELTDAGLERVERTLDCGNLHDGGNDTLLTELNCALHAHVLLRRNVDYIVRDGRIGIVDELTGRVVPDRHWPDGLQAALEAKEGLTRQPDGRILGSITLQHFLLAYPRLCGMTGTAQDAAQELASQYGLDVVVVPTNRPMIRVDRPDVVFTHREAKEAAIAEEVRRAHAARRPVLVGTLTVEESERLATRLQSAGIACEVLNAKHDEREARIVAGAGAHGAVTISTNMAGRGTDIRLGGHDEADRARVVALGGLYVIGTNRHESRRVDLQLRGRAGRQGDPGESRFFVSLEDDLLVRYGIRELIPNSAIPARQDAPIDSPIVRREIARAQRIVDGQNFEIRRTLWRYASAIEEQRRHIMERRHAMLHSQDPPDVWRQAPADRAALVAATGDTAVVEAERVVTLLAIDRAWRDHLAFVADLREGIHLVTLGGQDPLTRFTADTMMAFRRIEGAIDRTVLEALPRVRAAGGALRLDDLDIKGPSSTWTYLVNDDPFRHQIGTLLTGPGRNTIAIYAAVFMGPLLVLWGLVDRLRRRRRAR